MIASQITKSELMTRLRINERFGRLLREERTCAGKSLRSVARRMNITRESLRDWESGRSSPPANVFYSIIQFYGSAAMCRASELDLELQIEKYQMLVARKHAQSRSLQIVEVTDSTLAA